MKKTIIGVVLIVIGAIICFLCARTTGITSKEKSFIEDAAYVENAVIDQNNEGKAVIISGETALGHGSFDPDTNITIPSPFISRTVEIYKNTGDTESPKMKWEKVFIPTENNKIVSQNYYGTLTLGAFTLSGLFLQNCAHLELTDYTSLTRDNVDSIQMTVETPKKGPQYYTEAENITDDDNLLIYENARRISYQTADLTLNNAFTFVGTQKGSTLIPTNDFSVKCVQGVYTEPEEIIKQLQTRSTETTIFGFFVFLTCVIIGGVLIYPTLKKKFK